MSKITKGTRIAFFPLTDGLEKNYHGCGAALGKIKMRFTGGRQFLDELVEWTYIDCDEGGRTTCTPQTEQSINMTEDAGCVTCYETSDGKKIAPPEFGAPPAHDVYARVVLNISCYQACLG
jgi:hypothetical protein